ncbi:MFS transporter [Micromonospora narathiwatensis]|uniref:Predicted arabinose efflux permease, MFS family n=1 Tax=Micromonospora narathiwatensis TaxID=299146 RepID=A0A1A8ZGA3_9ACTN|nr:MFS transporter [Micromonospora narathiwatensis]SBT42903.1 Predicted arabinose efflux permease, MFS family [Micromonospora narathiwatensis]
MTERAATYAEVFAVREYRYLFTAYLLSLLGDQLTAVTVAYLVYTGTGSAALAAAGYASSYLAWLAGGPLLSGLADRFPRRRVLIGCDVARALLIPLAALPGVPAPALVALLFMVNLLRPPFVAARAALLPEVLDGDRYPLANGLDNTTAQVVQVLGFAAGGGLVAAFSLRGALVVDAATFLVSAVLIGIGVRPRGFPTRPEGPTRGGPSVGLRVVFTDRRLRAYVLVLWVASAFTYAAEGLMAPLARQYGGGPETVGLLLAAAPLGTAAGAVILTRWCPPGTRPRLILPLAVLSAALLTVVAFGPPLWIVLGLLVLVGAGSAFAIPLNALFGRAVPTEFRGRAFGVAITGLAGLQGGAMVLAGLAAERWAATTVVGVSGLLGAVAVLALAPLWPHRRARAVAAPLEHLRMTSTATEGSAAPSRAANLG